MGGMEIGGSGMEIGGSETKFNEGADTNTPGCSTLNSPLHTTRVWAGGAVVSPLRGKGK
jgi:hypothetical protein